MRGSIYYQTAFMIKMVFAAGAKKEERIDISHDSYQCLASFNSAETYRKVWNDLGYYLKDVFKVKDFENTQEEHITHYMQEKIAEGITHQHLQKISSAFGKLEIALNRISTQFGKHQKYDFSKRLSIVKQAKKEQLTKDNYRNRAYDNPLHVVSLLVRNEFKIAACIQLEGGARAEGVCLIKKDQLLGIDLDEVTGNIVGIIQTKEKGGKIGEIKMNVATYNELANVIEREGVFRIYYRRFTEAIHNACKILGAKPEGSHGFRWNFAQRRVIEYQEYGYSYDEALQMVSYEMKHMRPDITCHYCG